MNTIEEQIKEYSSKKLKEILEIQSLSYNQNFIDYAKDELIRRGESFEFNSDLVKEIKEMNDEDLKNLVEKEWNNYHLEYIEIARKEYLLRGFKNETEDEIDKEETIDKSLKRYPALRTIAGVYSAFAVITGIVCAFAAFYLYNQNQNIIEAIVSLIIGALILLAYLGASESIKVFIDIEENTRRNNNKI